MAGRNRLFRGYRPAKTINQAADKHTFLLVFIAHGGDEVAPPCIKRALPRLTRKLSPFLPLTILIY